MNVLFGVLSAFDQATYYDAAAPPMKPASHRPVELWCKTQQLPVNPNEQVSPLVNAASNKSAAAICPSIIYCPITPLASSATE